jgi:hypothetical protein
MKAVMTVKSYDTSIVIEKGNSDITIHEWLEMFATSMMGITFPKEVVARGMVEFGQELLNEINETE